MHECIKRDACMDRERPGKPSTAGVQPQRVVEQPAPLSAGRSQWSARRNMLQDKGFSSMPPAQAQPAPQLALHPSTFAKGDRVRLKRAFEGDLLGTVLESEWHGLVKVSVDGNILSEKCCMPIELEHIQALNAITANTTKEADNGNGLQVQASQAIQESQVTLLQNFAQMQDSVQARIAELTDIVKSLQVPVREGAMSLPPVPSQVLPRSTDGSGQDEVMIACERLFLESAKTFDEVLDHKLAAQTETVLARLSTLQLELGNKQLGESLVRSSLDHQPVINERRPPIVPRLNLSGSGSEDANMQAVTSVPPIPDEHARADSMVVTDSHSQVDAIVAKDTSSQIPQDEAVIQTEQVDQGDLEPLDLEQEEQGSKEGSKQLSRGSGSHLGPGWEEEGEVSKLMKPPEDLYNKDGIFRRICDNRYFYLLSVIMIVANAIYIGVEADWNDAGTLSEAAVGFQVCEHIFCAFFVFELIIHFGAYKRKRDSLKDRWFLLDLFLVALIVLETWVVTIMLTLWSNPPRTGAVGGVGRMLRLLRLTRISKLMQMVPELVTMVKGMVAAIRAVHAALLILLLLVYVFAMLMNNVIGNDDPIDKEYFSSVRSSMVTLVVQGVLLDDISGLTRHLISIPSGLALLILAVFVLLSALTVMNMLIGVLCQVVLDVSAQEKETNVKTQMQKTLLVMLQDLDADNSGMLSKEEVQEVMHLDKAVEIMKDIQVDTQHLLNLTEMIFADELEGLPINVIMNIVLSLRGDRTPSMSDLAKSNNFLLWALDTKLASHRQLMGEALLKSRGPSMQLSDGDVTIGDMHATLTTYSQKVTQYQMKLEEHHQLVMDMARTPQQHGALSAS